MTSQPRHVVDFHQGDAGFAGRTGDQDGVARVGRVDEELRCIFEPLGIVTAPALVVGSRISEAVNVAVARYVSQFSPACLIRR